MGEKVIDIVHEVLERAKRKLAEAYGLPDEVSDILGLLETEIKLDHRGERVTIPGPNGTDKVEKVKNDYLANLPVEDITHRHGISRRTMYYYLKK